MIMELKSEVCPKKIKVTYNDADYCIWCGEEIPHRGRT